MKSHHTVVVLAQFQYQQVVQGKSLAQEVDRGIACGVVYIVIPPGDVLVGSEHIGRHITLQLFNSDQGVYTARVPARGGIFTVEIQHSYVTLLHTILKGFRDITAEKVCESRLTYKYK